jgi:hypothetical protein
MVEMKKTLIIHVGMEKSGSSSVQKTMNKNQTLLNESGYFYLGLMLEEFSSKLFNWQNIRGWTSFIAGDKEKHNKELIHLFNEINVNLSKNIHTLIWSNESLFNSVEFIEPTLNWLKTIFNIKVIGYVRKPDEWIQSAYLQWGIKHKTYTGPLKTFSEWVSSKSSPVIPFILRWKVLCEEVNFYDFGVVKNITNHFLFESIGIPTNKNIEIVRYNDTPSPAQLALFSLYNSSFNGEVLPYRIESLLNMNSIVSDKNSTQEFKDLVPSKEDLNAYCDSVKDDFKELQKVLVKSNYTFNKLNEPNLKKFDYTQSDINLELLKLCISMSERISDLEKNRGDDK